MRRYGFHLSIGDGLANVPEKAKELGCTSVQIFSGNPRGWYQKEFDNSDLTLFKQKIKEYDIQPVVIHMPYLPNPASPDKNLYTKSLNTLIDVLQKAEQLSAEYVNMHVGKAMGSSFEIAVNRVIQAINTALIKASQSKTILLLENTAGQGTEIGNKFEHLKAIINKIDNKEKIGVCLDTAHLFGAGYDLRNKNRIDKTLTEFDEIVGLSYLKLIHYNDSIPEFNSQKDRHQHIGKGMIGEKGMKAIINHPLLINLPFIMETPMKQTGDDIRNLKTLKKYIR